MVSILMADMICGMFRAAAIAYRGRDVRVESKGDGTRDARTGTYAGWIRGTGYGIWDTRDTWTQGTVYTCIGERRTENIYRCEVRR